MLRTIRRMPVICVLNSPEAGHLYKKTLKTTEYLRKNGYVFRFQRNAGIKIIITMALLAS